MPDYLIRLHAPATIGGRTYPEQSTLILADLRRGGLSRTALQRIAQWPVLLLDTVEPDVRPVSAETREFVQNHEWKLGVKG